MGILTSKDLWNPNTYYYAKDRFKHMIEHEGSLYVCTESHVSGSTFDNSKFAALGAVSSVDTLSVDTLSVQQLTHGNYVFGIAAAASLKQLVLTDNNQSFNLYAATGTVVKFLVETVYDDYSPNLGDTFTLNNTAFDVIASYGSRFEVFHDPDNSHYNIRIINPTDVSGGNEITLVDANIIDDVLQCHGNYISLENSSLTGDLADWSLSGPQSTELAKLHDFIVFEMGTSSAFGITSIGGNTFGLAPGEKCLRLRGGLWVKL